MTASTSSSEQATKTIIITGANGNLGTAVTNLFLSKGYRVIATVHKEEEEKDFPAHSNLNVHAIDLSDEQASSSFIQSCMATYKQIDAALMLVGGFAMGKIEETTIADIKKQLTLNFDTAYTVVHSLLAHMLQNNNGRLVFIGSRPALEARDGKNMVAYALSKSLLFKLAEYINAEAKGKNVTATVLVPSTLDTAPNRQSMPNANPDNWVKPEAFAEILEFVVSEKAAPLRETILKVYNNA